MKKISFVDHVLPHLVAVVVFFLTTLFFFHPIFFENKALSQHDIQQFLGASKELRDFREATGQEGLWANSMFSGMPAYLVNLDWSDGAIVSMKRVMTLFLPHPVANIFLAFLSYYILLLTFRIRPGLAIAGGLAFGLSSFMIIGLVAGHNARIGAIAFMPLAMAGIHLVFSGKRWLGAGVTALGMALHLRENHLQMTYYLLLIVLVYGLVQLVYAFREKRVLEVFINVGWLLPAVLLAAATFLGPFWAITEYTRYSIRGPSEISQSTGGEANGLSKTYAFEYSNGLSEPFTLLVPNFLGGATSDYLVRNEGSETYRALTTTRDEQMANQLAAYSSAYWGPQSNTAPYYAGAVMVMLFVVGLVYAPRSYVYWLAPLSMFSILMSWGDSLPSFNYFLFDYLPGYNKFRSVTFALTIILFCIPLLGLLGLEEMLKQPVSDKNRTKTLVALFTVPALCLIFAVMGNLGSYLRAEETQLPAWFWQALKKDRVALLQADAWRSFWFSLLAIGAVLAVWQRWIKATWVLPVALVALVALDLALVNRRYLTSEAYQRKSSQRQMEDSEADKEVLQDKDYYRVFNLQDPFNEARTSYFHHSLGGYHGAKLRRYNELIDSAINKEYGRFIANARQGSFELADYPVLNMLNARYLVFGPAADNVIENPNTNGNAWFVKNVMPVQTPAEELAQVTKIDTKETAVVDESKFKLPSQDFQVDSTAVIRLMEYQPNKLVYESVNGQPGLAVFSEIYYPKGWRASVDGEPVSLIRVNYVLRALSLPAGTHRVEMVFDPAPYRIGNPISAAAGWLVLAVVAAAVGVSIRKEIA
jgi:hypothetical protein